MRWAAMEAHHLAALVAGRGREREQPRRDAAGRFYRLELPRLGPAPVRRAVEVDPADDALVSEASLQLAARTSSDPVAESGSRPPHRRLIDLASVDASA